MEDQLAGNSEYGDFVPTILQMAQEDFTTPGSNFGEAVCLKIQSAFTLLAFTNVEYWLFAPSENVKFDYSSRRFVSIF